MEAAAFAKIFPSEYHQKFVDSGCRIDGRTFTTIRKTTIKPHPLETADGSALVKIGQTSVVCGIKLEVGIPHASRPTDGKMLISVNTPAACSAMNAINVTPATVAVNVGSQSMANVSSNSSIAEFLERVVYDSQLFNPSQLGIMEGMAAWVLYVDIVCLNNDGNFIDAAVLALVSALLDLSIPSTISPDEKTVYITDGPKTKLVIGSSISSLSMAMYKGQLIIDPSLEEERYADSILTVIMNDQGKYIASS